MKTCATCVHVYTDPTAPKYSRCRKSDAAPADDASLCGLMRKGVCGPEGKLWEPKNGQTNDG